MVVVRKIWTVVVSAWVAGFLARALLDWVLGLEGTWVAAAIVGAALLGGVAGAAEARQLPPVDPAERRDVVLGWGGLIGGVAAVACLFLPMPWGAVASATVVAGTVLLLRIAGRRLAVDSGSQRG